MILETRAAPPFMKNGFVLGCEDTREGVVIDPGDDVELLLDAVERPRSVDSLHSADARPPGSHHRCRTCEAGARRAGRAAPRRQLPLRGSSAAGTDVRARRRRPNRLWTGSTTVPVPWTFGRYAAWVHHTPGHCPGGVCLAVGRSDSLERTLFVGDTLFAGGIGRTDLPGGNLPTLLRSIRDVLFSFPDETVVYSGHGEETTIGREKRTNPFLNAD